MTLDVCRSLVLGNNTTCGKQRRVGRGARLGDEEEARQAEVFDHRHDRWTGANRSVGFWTKWDVVHRSALHLTSVRQGSQEFVLPTQACLRCDNESRKWNDTREGVLKRPPYKVTVQVGTGRFSQRHYAGLARAGSSSDRCCSAGADVGNLLIYLFL